jgi:AcrR family transcriptional regulator
MAVTSPAPADSQAPAASRADRRRAKRIDDILRIATGLLAERGYAATSLDEIAEVLDLSKASLYHYFPSKEDLIMACLDRVADESDELLRAAAARALSPRDRLHALVRAQVLMLTRDEPAGAALFLRDVGLPETARVRIRPLVERHDRLFRSIIEEGIGAGELHVADPAVSRLLMHGAVNFIPTWYATSRRMPPERLADVVADTLLQLFGAGAS